MNKIINTSNLPYDEQIMTEKYNFTIHNIVSSRIFTIVLNESME